MAQQRSKTRISILRGAKKLFGLTGYQSTTLDDIAKVAGLSASTMQAHFENKESLLLETQRTIFRQLHTRITERNQSSEKFNAQCTRCSGLNVEFSERTQKFCTIHRRNLNASRWR